MKIRLYDIIFEAAKNLSRSDVQNCADRPRMEPYGFF